MGSYTPRPPMTPKQLETAIQGFTCTLLGVDITDKVALAGVRLSWQTQGQPFGNNPGVNVVFIRAVPEDSLYDRVRDRITVPNPASEDNSSVLYQDLYTRVWRIYWVFYGPDSFDRARVVRSALYQQANHDILALSSLYIAGPITAPIRLPDQSNGQWWERTDFSVLMNEFVVEQTEVSTVESVEILVNDADSANNGVPLADITVE